MLTGGHFSILTGFKLNSLRWFKRSYFQTNILNNWSSHIICIQIFFNHFLVKRIKRNIRNGISHYCSSCIWCYCPFSSEGCRFLHGCWVGINSLSILIVIQWRWSVEIEENSLVGWVNRKKSFTTSGKVPIKILYPLYLSQLLHPTGRLKKKILSIPSP